MAATGKWVVNASPLICLGKLRRLDWLGQLASEFVVPFGVATEIEGGPPDDPARQWLQAVGSVHVRRVGEIPAEIAGWDLGRGESEVLAWARENRGYVAILDDRAARRCADVFNVSVCGTVGILMRAKREGLVNSLTAALDDAAKVGLYVSPAVRREALRLLGE
ncbi:MAG TPA: DUF3368 domain-containing protein [Opitutaceae bacterium]